MIAGDSSGRLFKIEGAKLTLSEAELDERVQEKRIVEAVAARRLQENFRKGGSQCDAILESGTTLGSPETKAESEATTVSTQLTKTASAHLSKIPEGRWLQIMRQRRSQVP